MVRMNKVAVVAKLLLPHQFFFGVNGGVQHVILACNIALEINPSWVMLDLDRPATSFRMFCEGLKQGDAPATVCFNVLATRVYMRQLRMMYGKGVLFTVADDVKILDIPEVITEMAEGFPTLAWEKSGLTTQTAKNRIYVQSSTQTNWCRFLDLTPRNARSELPVHAIPYGNERVDPFDPDSERIW
jgi:hypothetical protein